MVTRTALVGIQVWMAKMATNKCSTPSTSGQWWYRYSGETDRTADNTSTAGIHNVLDISRYSCINRLLVVTSYVLRFVHNACKRQPKLTGTLTVTELNTAQKIWISTSQNLLYQHEITYLMKKNHKCPTLVKQLRLFLDKDNLLRCGSRIHNAPVNELTKFPFLLPPKHNLTDMIIRDTHHKLHHGGASSTVTVLRQVTGSLQFVKVLRNNWDSVSSAIS